MSKNISATHHRLTCQGVLSRHYVGLVDCVKGERHKGKFVQAGGRRHVIKIHQKGHLLGLPRDGERDSSVLQGFICTLRQDLIKV